MEEDPKLLAARKWFGYGRWNSPYWFLGMEPGGTDDHASYEAWQSLGGTELIDCREHHLRSGFSKWHQGDRPPTQATWRRLIQLLLGFKGEFADLNSVRTYQKNPWGSIDGETAVLEVSALHARSLSEDVDRNTYRDKRIATLGERLKEHRPRFVIMYGLGYRDIFEQVIGAPLRNGHAWQGSSLCALVEHPTARPGKSPQWWIEKGKEIRSMIQGR